MGKTILGFIPLVEDVKFLTLIDTSYYNKDVPVTDSIFRITLPNFNKYVDVDYPANGVLNVNSNLLRLTNTSNPENLTELPSGLYKIRQSICPNDKIFKEKTFFNIQPDLMKLASIVCAASKSCDNDKLKELFILKSRLDEAKILAERCCLEKEAVALYNATVEKINKAQTQCDC